MSIVGTAGWTIPALYKNRFPNEGSHLERYAARLKGVEINSSFYRPHKRTTYERWAACVPENFRFSVKMPRTITQNHRLKDCGPLLEQFQESISGLGNKLGVVLAQLPPSLAFDASTAGEFFSGVTQIEAAIACEPRHVSWFTEHAGKMLRDLRVTRVAADPPRGSGDGMPGGDMRLAYFRLHGSPKIYYSDYPESALEKLAPKLRENDWCIFDNTAAFHATGNALTLDEMTSENKFNL